MLPLLHDFDTTIRAMTIILVLSLVAMSIGIRYEMVNIVAGSIVIFVVTTLYFLSMIVVIGGGLGSARRST